MKILLNLIFFVVAIFCNAQNCVPQTAGSAIGNRGCVKLQYRGAQVFYSTVRAADGNEWLQQNLGSTRVAENIADELGRGDYFQFGRWDDGHQLKNSMTTNIYPEPNNPKGLGSGSGFFYIGGGSPWSSDYTGWFANPNQDDRWEARNISEITEHNGMDPCSALGEGWEMPSEQDWNLVLQKENIFPKPQGATTTGIERGFSSNLKIPGAGARKDNGMTYEGQRGYLWTKTASANPNFYRYVYLGTAASSTTGFGGDAKSFGYSVRCVKKTNTLSTSDLNTKENFGIFPNPAPNKQVTVVYDMKNTSVKRGIITIFDMAGRKVYATEIGKEQGFFKKELQLGNLSAGTYMVNLNVDGANETKKLILN